MLFSALTYIALDFMRKMSFVVVTEEQLWLRMIGEVFYILNTEEQLWLRMIGEVFYILNTLYAGL